MGGHFWTHIAVWTFLCFVVISADRGLLQDLGLDALPDVTKINVSQDEYTRMMTIYLQRLQESSELYTIPKLLTFNSDTKPWRGKENITRIHFPIENVNPDLDVESAEVRLLTTPVPGKDSILVQIYQILGPRRRRFMEEKRLYTSQTDPKWNQFDITIAAQNWINGERNLGLEIECSDCEKDLKLLQASLSLLAYTEPRRRKRSISYSKCRGNNKKQKCCRHEMMVEFKSLKVPQMDAIIQPKVYEAGYCKGRCPPNYNYATNHSRIQSLVHKLDNTKPRACCAPSKLKPLEILRVNPKNASSLSVEIWDNMVVLECACS